MRYSDLPRNAQLALTIWDIYSANGAIPVGGTTITLFGKYGLVTKKYFCISQASLSVVSVFIQVSSDISFITLMKASFYEHL